MYRPDRVLARRLREYDPNLFLAWDSGRERWILWSHHQDGQDRQIAVIQNEDGSFRPADDRILAQVWAADVLRRYGSAAEMMRVLDEKNHALEQGQRNLIRDEIAQISKSELYRCFFGGPQIAAGIDVRALG